MMKLLERAVDAGIEFGLDSLELGHQIARQIHEGVVETVEDAKAAFKAMVNRRTRRQVLRNAKKSLIKIPGKTFRAAKAIVRDILKHWKGATVLTLAAIGLSHILGELPMMIWLPAIFEMPMVTPVLSVLIITMLVGSMRKQPRRAT